MGRILKCENCGAVVEVLVECKCDDCEIECCDDEMVELSEEEAKEYENK